MNIREYFSNSAKSLIDQSNLIKNGFSSHHLSSGQNKEDLVGKFLQEYLPSRVDVDSGLIFSNDGVFSNEADLILTDRLYNAPLFPGLGKKLWYVESVFSMIEVKSQLNTNELVNCIDKCRMFKSLKREFSNLPTYPGIRDSLFIIWAFNGLEPINMKETILSEINEVGIQEQPDIIIVPDKYIITLGSYRALSNYGLPNSEYFLANGKDKLLEDTNNNKKITFYNINENSLLAFIIWVSSWINAAGSRSAPLQKYLQDNYVFGTEL